MVFVLSACGTTENSIPSTTDTPTSSPTETPIPPTATIEPSPTPAPIGGGGTIYMQVNQKIIPEEWNVTNPCGWFSSSSDGSNLSLLEPEMEIYNISPDGKFMIVRVGGKLAVMETSDGSLKILNTENETYLSKTYDFIHESLIYYAKSVIWLPDDRFVFLASAISEGKSIFYISSPDGNSVTKLNQPTSTAEDETALLFLSKNESNKFYWVTGRQCQERGMCDEKYFLSNIDDLEQQQVWQEIKNSGDNIFLSPSGKYIAHGAYFGNRDENNGCYLATIDGEPISKIEVEGESFCNRGNIWSPKEDKLLAYGWETRDESLKNTFRYNKKYYVVWTAPDGNTMRLPDFGDEISDCGAVEWLPDGQHIFFATCTDVFYGLATNVLGQRLVDVTTNEVKDFPSFGFCNYGISPAANWVLFYSCKTGRTEDKITLSSQLLNLETGETLPIFEEFMSNNPIKNATERWTIYWSP